ncbi:MAG: energy transducer TonB [Bacteroidales bacterium]|jgi:protein TonB|nr:energy transducer TonB [Bacteroidales bacterium]
MELKKSIKADLEREKISFFLIGLVIALLLVYMAFELVGSREKSEIMFASATQLVEEEKVIQTEQPKELPPPPPQQMSQTIIEIVSDVTTVEDFTIDAESDEHLEVEEVVYVEDTREEEVKEAEIFTVVEELPEFPGGDEARQKFLKDNLEYPRIARETGLEGRVQIGFVVEPDGRLTNFKVLRGRAPSLDEEALRVAKLMPKWKAGKQRGKAVRVQYQMPITFTLY